jgi:serine/threonine protein kinase
MTISVHSPALLLQGEALRDGWTVVAPIPKHPAGTGGHFSACYTVKNVSTGQVAFLKAIDVGSALQSADPMRELQKLTAAFNFERDVLNKCRSHRMKRVLVPIADGSHVVAASPPPINNVPYIIFELASGDIRAFHAVLAQFDVAWCLRSLHHSAVGLQELHYRGIAHQDLKPSNVLTFPDKGSKLADLGRSFDVASTSPHDSFQIPGDRTYASPEQLYGLINADGLNA